MNTLEELSRTDREVAMACWRALADGKMDSELLEFVRAVAQDMVKAGREKGARDKIHKASRLTGTRDRQQMLDHVIKLAFTVARADTTPGAEQPISYAMRLAREAKVEGLPAKPDALKNKILDRINTLKDRGELPLTIAAMVSAAEGGET